MLLTAQEDKLQRKLVLQGFILTLVLFFLIALANRTIISVSGFSEWSSSMFIISRLFFWLWLGMIYIYVIRREKQPFLLWPEKRYWAGFYFASVIGIIFVMMVGNMIIAWMLNAQGLLKESSQIKIVRQFSFPVKVFISLTAAITEEFIFRGYLITRLQLFFKNSHWPIIISSVLFGLAHARWGTILNVVGPMFIGFVCAYHYQKYRNIKVLMVCHFL